MQLLSRLKMRLQRLYARQQFDRWSQRVQSQDPMVRAEAVVALARLHDHRAIALMVAALQDSTGIVRYSATRALRDKPDSLVVVPLRAALMGEMDAYTRLLMALELVRRGDADYLARVFEAIAALDDEGIHDWDDAPQIAVAIAQLGGRALVPLTNALAHTHSTVRWIAVLALGELRDERAIAPLVQALRDEAPHVRSEAAMALKDLKELHR